MKKFTTIAYGGGVVALSIILALSLTFASCNNNSNSDDESPSPSLPANVGENPIEKTIKLMQEHSSDSYLELRTDGTALYGGKEGTKYKFKYTYDADAKKIYMRLEKLAFSDIDGLLNYDENLALMDEVYSVAALKEWIKEEYDDWGKEKSDSYEDFEKDWYEEEGFGSLAAYAEYYKQLEKNSIKAAFGAQVTYSYKIDGGKMTLTENFTGVKNLLDSECEYDDSSNGTWCDIRIWSGRATFYEYEYNYVEWDYVEWGYYSGIPDTGKIVFRNNKDGSIVNSTYTENISAETVTINFNDKDYVCKFEGRNFTQE